MFVPDVNVLIPVVEKVVTLVVNEYGVGEEDDQDDVWDDMVPIAQQYCRALNSSSILYSLQYYY